MNRKLLWKLVRWVQLFVFTLLFFAMGAWIGTKMDQLTPIFLLISTCLSLYLGILLHEFGHLLFGILTGYRFSSFRIGKWMWYQVDGHVVFTTYHIPGTAGQCLLIPKQANDDYPYFWYLAGGGLMNMIVAIICFFLSTIFSDRLAIFFIIFSASNFLLGLGNLVPYKNFIANDGYTILSLHKNKKARKAFALQLILLEAQVKGIRIRDLEEDHFVYADEKDLQNEVIATSQMCLVHRELDRKCYDKAYEMMTDLLQRDIFEEGELMRYMLELEVLYFDLLQYRHSSIEERYHKKLRNLVKSLVGSHLAASRFLYAYEKFYRQNESESQRHLSQFEKVAQKYPYKGDLELERELLQLATEEQFIF